MVLTPERTDRLRILFVGGTGRSGSTVLAAMLGQVPGFVNVGEARYIWQKGLLQDRLCGCGARLRLCPFWSQVAEEAFGGWDAVDPREMEALRAAADQPWYVPMLALPGRRSAADARARAYAEVLERLYRAVQKVSGASVIVDTSRFASYALVLRRVPDADVRVVHVVRDSRGVAFSWQKKVAVPDSPERTIFMPTYSLWSGSARWLAYNVQTWLLRVAGMPYVCVRYEDLVPQPRPHLERILRLAGADAGPDPLSFLGDGSATLDTAHTVMGNPMRLSKGSVQLRLDEEWRHGMERDQRLAVTALTLPLLLWYRYPLRLRSTPRRR